MATKLGNMVTYLDGLFTIELFDTKLGKLPPSEMIKNTFHLILKALSVLKIFKFLSRLLVMLKFF